jgi:hypothetical protein
VSPLRPFSELIQKAEKPERNFVTQGILDVVQNDKRVPGRKLFAAKGFGGTSKQKSVKLSQIFDFFALFSYILAYEAQN